MATAIVMIDAEQPLITEVATQIANIPEVREVYSVTGDEDLIAIVTVPDYHDFAKVIADGINKIPGIVKTKTYLAFREFSAKDLDVAFDLGLSD